MLKYVYLLACAAFFGAGAYVWKVKYTGLNATQAKDEAGPQAQSASDAAFSGNPGGVVVEIAGDKVTHDDVEWEYRLVTAELEDKETLTPIPDLGDKLHRELSPLKRRIVADIIERKTLYKFVQQDKEWTFDDPSRFTSCMEELAQTLREAPHLAEQKESKARLRQRLCERSIIDQYLKERLFSRIKIGEGEILEYFKNHSTEFKTPERVEIKQVLLATDGDAKKLRAQINTHNFEALARDHSIAPEAADGGRLGPFSKAALPSVFEVAFHMKKGEISEILKSPYGYHVIMLVAKHPPTSLSLDEARPKIDELLRTKRQGDEYQKWVERALAAVNVSTPKPLW